MPGLSTPKPTEPVFLTSEQNNAPSNSKAQQHNLELQLLPSSNALSLKLSIGSSCDGGGRNESNKPNLDTSKRPISENGVVNEQILEVTRLKDFASEELKLAMAEKAFAEEARREAKRQIEIAELDFANAKRIRQQAQSELEKAQVLKEQAIKKISSTMLQITCQACKQQFHASTVVSPSDEISLAVSYMSSATTEGEGE